MPRQRLLRAKRPNHRQQNADANYPASACVCGRTERRQCRNTVQNDFYSQAAKAKLAPKGVGFIPGIRLPLLGWWRFFRQTICRLNSKTCRCQINAASEDKCPHDITIKIPDSSLPFGTLTKSMRRSELRRNIIRSGVMAIIEGVSQSARVSVTCYLCFESRQYPTRNI